MNFFLINLPRCWSYNFNSIEILMAWVNLWGKKPAKNPNISETQASSRLGLQKNVSRLATASKIVTHHFPLKMKPKIRDSSRFHWDSSEVIWRKFRLKLNPIRFRNIPVFSITDKLNAKSYPEIYFSFYNTNSCIATVTWRYINRKIVLFFYTATAEKCST